MGEIKNKCLDIIMHKKKILNVDHEVQFGKNKNQRRIWKTFVLHFLRFFVVVEGGIMCI